MLCSTEQYCVVRSSTESYFFVVLCVQVIRKGSRAKMESGNGMGSLQQVANNSHRHILVYMYFQILKLPAPPRAVLQVLQTI